MSGWPEREGRGPTPVTSLLAVAVAAVFFATTLWSLIATSMPRLINHDEYWYLAAGSLIHDGLLPYRDFHCLHMPYGMYLFAVLAWLTEHLLLAGRLLAVCCDWALLGLVFWIVRSSLVRFGGALATVAALGAAFSVFASPLYLSQAGKAWNYPQPLLLALGAVTLVAAARRAPRPNWRLVFAGLLGGAAVGFRLSYVFVVPVLMAGWVVARRTRREVIGGLAWLSMGVSLALAAVVPLAAAAPARFLFDVVGYHRLQPLVHASQGVVAPSDLADKVQFLAVLLFVKNPQMGLALLGALALAATRCRREWRASDGVLWLALAASLLLAAAVPSPSWPQYALPVLPAAVVAATLLLGEGVGLGRVPTARTLLAVIPAVALVGIFLAPARDRPRLASRAWAAVVVHELDRSVRAYVADRTILTLAPVVALEWGARIYPEFATGPFIWRTARFVPRHERARLAVVGPDEIESLLAVKRPDAMLLGIDQELERPLLSYAVTNGFRPATVAAPALWISPQLLAATPHGGPR